MIRKRHFLRSGSRRASPFPSRDSSSLCIADALIPHIDLKLTQLDPVEREPLELPAWTKNAKDGYAFPSSPVANRFFRSHFIQPSELSNARNTRLLVVINAVRNISNLEMLVRSNTDLVLFAPISRMEETVDEMCVEPVEIVLSLPFR